MIVLNKSTERKLNAALKTGDRILTNIVPITQNIVNKEKNNGNWGFQSLLSTPINSYCLTEMADWQLRKEMYLNWAEKQTTLDMIGDSITGMTNKISDEIYRHNYSYTENNNYIGDYQIVASSTSTSLNVKSDVISHNSSYGKIKNLYYDDDGTGNENFTRDDKIESYDINKNRNSILTKTKQLFNKRKINTIISRFHTEPSKMDDNDVGTQKYGMSHGRNLLTYDAENGISYTNNGYDNPYCRVWTHHHQYSDFRTRLMRPFSYEEVNGEVGYPVSNKDLHKWNGFKSDSKTRKVIDTSSEMTAFGLATGNYDMMATKDVEEKEWGWKDNGAGGWDKSVLNKITGLVNIAPKFLGGAQKNVHTKDCMFSIENLAWQGYDPYSFEKALSWEQRGPFGGRIMWFPPYGLRFNEESSVNWNEHTFIGRGENVYTYTNTVRSGTLEFMMVVDHPSILDYSTWYGGGTKQNEALPKDTDIYRFFAGCDAGKMSGGSNSSSGGNDGGSLLSYVKPTPLTDEYLKKDNTEAVKVTENKKQESKTHSDSEVPSSDEEITISFYVFFPNNYSGYYDNDTNSKVNPIAYLLCGKGAQWKCPGGDYTRAEVLPIDFKDISSTRSEFFGNGYEMKASNGISVSEGDNYILGTSPNWSGYTATRYKANKDRKWYYRIDGKYEIAKGEEQYKNTFDQKLVIEANYRDSRSYGLNCNVETVRQQFPEESSNVNLYSLAEIAYALNEGNTFFQGQIYSRMVKFDEERINKLKELFDTSDKSVYKVTEISGIGYSNSHGENANQTLNDKRNDFLARQRCNTVIKWFKESYGKGTDTIKSGAETSESNQEVGNKDTNSDSAKRWRSAKIAIKIKKSAIVEPKDMNQRPAEDEKKEENYTRFVDFKEAGTDTESGTQLYEKVIEEDPSKKGRKWYYNEPTQEMRLWDKDTVLRTRYGKWTDDSYKNTQDDYNKLRYDQEYHFFKQLEATHPDVFDTLVEKLQFFDPAFHSMTPEGFMGRLTFLQQCTRQGNTISASDENGHSANNLAFGRPPFCILRLGDFYYQKIVIRNISISYDPLVLDLNNEGIGVVPLIANVTISFNFIGGGDLSGPVRRLQSAMSFNFFSNTRLYDNRADRVEREQTNWETMGAMGHDKVDFDASYFHNVQMAK